MTPLNNQELKEKIAGIYDNPEDPEYCLEDLISEKAMNQLLALFESELANREREACKKGFIKGGIIEGNVYDNTTSRTQGTRSETTGVRDTTKAEQTSQNTRPVQPTRLLANQSNKEGE